VTFKELKEISEVASYLTIVLGLPLALYQYRRKTYKEQLDREYGTYNALDEKYLEFVRLCFDYPQLDIFDIPDASPSKAPPIEEKRELIAFTMLFSIFERAYLMYADQRSTIKKRQWSGWHEYLTEYCARVNFRRAWRISGNTFDTSFQEFVELTIRQAAPAGAHVTIPVREVLSSNATDVAEAADLAATARIAGSKVTGNELSFLLTTADLGIRTRALLAEAPDGTRGALITSTIDEGQIAVLTGVGIRGPSIGLVWQALLRSADEQCFSAGTVVVEAVAGAEEVLRQTVPGMGSFREVLVPYRHLDGSKGHLWVWTTADTMTRTEVSTLIIRLILGFYAPLRARSMAQSVTAAQSAQIAQQALTQAPALVPLRGVDLAVLPIAHAG
jgi:hypothetical protein